MRFLIWLYAAVTLYDCSACSSLPESCVALVQLEKWDAAFPVCAGEYESGRDPKIGIFAARAAYYLEKWADAKRLAGGLSRGPRAADAESLLGWCALAESELEVAVDHLQRAMSMHGEAGDFPSQARDAHQLSGARFQQGEYERGMEALQAAHDAATRTNDSRMQAYVDMARTDLYRGMGDRLGAEQAIERAVARALDREEDRAFARFKQGTIQLEAGLLGPAEATFERVLAEERRTAHTQFAAAALLNLALIDRKRKRFASALARVEEARGLGVDEMSVLLNRGMILADQGKLAEAAADLRAAEAASPTGEWSWWVPYQVALVATKAGDLDGAIAACRRSIEKVTALAGKSGAYGPMVIAGLRQPHLHLIGLLAQRRAWSEVLAVVATLDAHALLDSTEEPIDLPPPAGALVRAAPPRRDLVDPYAILRAWRGRRLVVVVPGGERIWRLVVRDGELEGRDLGAAAPLEKHARALEVHPYGDVEAGRSLGEAILDDAAPDGPVDLLVVGQLAKAPLAALRIGDELASARFRLARVPGVLPSKSGAGTPATPGRVLVLGDPGRDLPASAGEAARIAERLGTSAYTHEAATRAAFAAASGAALLHVSAHTVHDLDGPAVLLSDGRIRVADIMNLAPGPRRVVLASCAAGAGKDDAGNGSLANAFLDAGAEYVIATRWTVQDADAARLVAAFYQEGGDRDPVQGLAAAQLHLANQLQEHSWAAFEVLAGRPAPSDPP